ERNLIWFNDSSPETYKTGSSLLTCADNCNARVDFPIPGSPLNKISEPGTSPPLKTRSNSLLPVSILFTFNGGISFNKLGKLCSKSKAPRLKPTLLVFSSAIFCSFKVFHSPQFKHFPAHLENDSPQLLQINWDFVF